MATPLDTNRGFVEIFDEFPGGTVISGASDSFVGQWWGSADAGGTSGVVANGTNNLGGRWRLATDATDDDMSEGPCSGLIVQPQDGEMHFEARLMVETGTVVSTAINMGFNDDPTDASNTLPVELSTTTFTSNAATFAGLVFDADATNDDWHAFYVDDSVNTTVAIANLRYTSSTPVADTWQTLRVSLVDAGSGNGSLFESWVFTTDGKQQTKRFTGTVDRDVVLCSYIGMENRDGIAHNVDIDYVYLKFSRGTTA